jgi:DNA-binding CsgD family transcriptional regulator
MRSFDAVALFEERARAATGEFVLTDDNCAAVARISEQLEGLPLAIELAASRIRGLGLDGLERRLAERFSLLIDTRDRGGRYDSLHAAIAWSYDLCSPAEQAVWARAGGFDLAAAEVVCGVGPVSPGAVWQLVDSLVSKSVLLVEQVGGGHTRYRMLEALRAYGLDRLHRCDEYAATRVRHRDWLLGVAEQRTDDAAGPAQTGRLDRLPAEHANIRTALEHCISQPDPEQIGLRIAVGLWRYWLGCGQLSEARHWLRRLLAVDQQAGTVRAEALFWAVMFAHLQWDTDEIRSYADECSTVAAELRDEGVAALAAHCAAYVGLLEPDYELVEQRCAEAVRQYEGEPRAQAALVFACDLAAFAATTRGAYDVAEQWVDRAQRAAAESGDRYCRAHTLWTSAITRWAAGFPDEAKALARESLAIQHSHRDLRAVLSIDLLSRVAALAEDAVRAAVLLGVVDHLVQTTGFGMFELRGIGELRTAWRDRIQEALGDEQFEQHLAAGRKLDFAQAVTYALHEPADVPWTPADATRDVSASPLSRRERQVAALVAQGLSNKQIANRLAIAQRTAESHVEKILAKLGFQSRVQVAAWLVGLSRTADGGSVVGHPWSQR